MAKGQLGADSIRSKEVIMKRFGLIVLMLILCVAVQGQASSLWNGRLTAQLTAPATASAASVTGPGLFYGIIVLTDGTNNVTVNVYDNTAASSTKLIPTDFIVSGSNRSLAISYDPGVKFSTGIYVDISVAGGGSCSFQILYDQ